MRHLWLALLFACMPSVGAFADAGQPPVAVTPLLSTSTTASGQPITLPSGPASVGVSRYVIAPGAKLPVHKHPHPRYAYVLAGTLVVHDDDTGQSYTYKTGDFIVEVLDQWHYGENIGADAVELLVIDQTPEGTTVNTIVQP